ncbi:hypothetical protein [Pseudophaeobacter flagellatus]|uniref:hypothetical protein n=1 Tax=Pseudophaeobacter flagellatus TaxID=2899119 RepID=UPI001E5327EB|nr:hypothetical protein [Pseudophaeobacter flagellatus]
MNHTVVSNPPLHVGPGLLSEPGRAVTGPLGPWLAWITAIVLLLATPLSAHEVEDFFGRYSGTATFETATGEEIERGITVEIAESGKGFSVQWTTISEQEDGRRKVKSYDVSFLPSDREGIFAAAMQRDLFGHAEQHDPMKGRPYVWARLTGDVLTVFSMFIHPNGDYEIQQYDRSLTETGLHLVFRSHRNGVALRQIEVDLLRQ